MLSYLRAACTPARLSQARKSPVGFLVKKRTVSPLGRALSWKKGYSQKAAQVLSDVPASNIASPTTLKGKSDNNTTAIRKILDDVATMGVGAGPTRIESAASELLDILTPTVRQYLRSQIFKQEPQYIRLLLDISHIFLRCGRVEDLEELVLSLSAKHRVSALFNEIWSTYVQNDVSREELVLSRVDSRRMFSPGEQARYLFEYSVGGSNPSLLSVATSIQRAVALHDVSPSDRTLSSLVLATLRMIPADLKSLRQEIIRKERSQADMDRLKAEIDIPTTHHDLTPSNASEYLPTLNSIYENPAPIIRRPIPIEKSHAIVRDALGPIWDLLKAFSGELRLREISTLLRGFNKATLVAPTLHLVPHLKRFEPLPFLAETYALALDTLCDDIQYDHVYAIYKDALLDPKTQELRPFATQNSRLLAPLFQGVSRASYATRKEKEYLFNFIMQHPRPMYGDALASYCYAMSRDASVTPAELFDIFNKCAAIPHHKHHLKYLNDIFFGLSVRGAFHLAHKVLSDMWTKGATISASSVELYLDRCISARQVDLVSDVLALMRPTSVVRLHSDRGRKSITTSKNLPVRLSVPQPIYLRLFDLYARLRDEESLSQALHDYQHIENYALDRVLFRKLLSHCRMVGSPLLSGHVCKIFNAAGLKTGVEEANMVLHAYNQARMTDEALAYWNSFPTMSLTPNEDSYANLVYTYGNSFQIEKSIEVLEVMDQAGVAATATIFEALMAVLSPTSVEKAEWILQHMDTVKVRPTLKVYQPILKTYADQGNVAMFHQHLDHVTQNTGLSLTIPFCKMLVQAFSQLGELNSIRDWLIPLMVREKLPMDEPDFVGSLVCAYYRLSQDSLSEKTLLELPKRRQLQQQSRLIAQVFVPALKYLASVSLSRTWNLIRLMETKCGVPVGQNLYASVLEEVKMQNNAALEEEALSWMREHLHPVEFEALETTLRST